MQGAADGIPLRIMHTDRLRGVDRILLFCRISAKSSILINVMYLENSDILLLYI